jgi:hypothetical protein
MLILINFVMILVYAAILYLILYLFSKYVTPIDQKILGIITFIVVAILVVTAFSGHSLLFWK